MTALTLRPYQQATVEWIELAYPRLRSLGKRPSVVVQAPTGSGKGLMIAAIRPQVVIAPGIDLVRQLQARVQGATVHTAQALSRALDKGEPLPPAARVAFDEARWITSEKWSRIPRWYLERGAELALFDATPATAQGQGLGSVADDLLQVSSMRELISAGFLVPFRVWNPAARQKHLCQRPVDAWIKVCNGRRALVFCRDKAHAADTVREFVAEGIPAGYICDDAKEADRRKLLGWTDDQGIFHPGDLARGKIWVLVCAQLLRQGIDVPEVAAILIARRCGSYPLFMQAIGRGGRPCKWIGKTDCIVVDLYGGLVTEHGLPEDGRIWSLDGVAARVGEALPSCVQCKECGTWGTSGPCSVCGHVLPPPPPPRVRAKELIEVRSVEPVEHKQKILLGYVEQAASKGHNLYAAKHRYRGVYGQDPPAQWLHDAITQVTRARSTQQASITVGQ